jgi:hypothetical protein
VSRGEWSGVWVHASRTKLINLVIHDNGDGVGLWRSAVDAEVYGCIIFNNGWRGPDRGWGHGIYVQNLEGTKHITNDVIFDNFGYGIHGYDGVAGAYASNIKIDGVTSFANGSPTGIGYPNIFVGTNYEPSDNIEVARSVAYVSSANWPNVLLGYTAGDNGTVSVHDNQFIGGSEVLSVANWKHPLVTDNTFRGMRPSADDAVLVDLHPPTDSVSGAAGVADVPGPADRSWDSNTYLDSDGSAERPFQVTDSSHSRSLSFDGWRKATHYDGSSSFATEHATDTKVLVYPNSYSHGRAHIVVFNWSGRSSVGVDLSQAGVDPHTSYQIKDIQNLAGPPVAGGVYEGGSVSVPMTGEETMAPIGNAPVRPAHTPREFGVFLVVS